MLCANMCLMLCAASQLPKRQPTEVEDAPAPSGLKPDDDEVLSGADEWVEVFLQKEQRWICKYSILYSKTLIVRTQIVPNTRSFVT